MLEAVEPKSEATFGLSMAPGKLSGFQDDRDDLVVCAPTEDEGMSFDQVGAAHIYLDASLSAPPENFRLTPTPPFESLMNLGERSVIIANPRGFDEATSQPRDNLILISCKGKSHTYPGCGTVGDIGSVEMYDYNAAGPLGVPQVSLFPPLNPTTDPCPAPLPTLVRGFGHGLAVADVNRDGVVDLIVGAPNTRVADIGVGGSHLLQNNWGRIYIFLGHGDELGNPPENDFWDDPYVAWLGIDAPESPDINFGIPEDWGGFFGAYVVGMDLAGDPTAEVVVGRSDKENDVSPCETQPPVSPNDCPPQGGSVYVFRGEWLHDQFEGAAYHPTNNPSGTWNRVITPPRPDPELVGQAGGLNASLPEYQVLRNPFGDVQPDGGNPRAPHWFDWFGWIVFDGGDCGSPHDDLELAGDFDGVNDLIVHAEASAYIGVGDFETPEVANVGGLFVYHGRGLLDGPEIVDPRPVLLQRPININGGIPSAMSRIGRAMARTDAWFNCEEDALEPALFIAETDAPWGGVTMAGIVTMTRLPLPAPADPVNDPWWVPRPIVNAWGSTPLLEPLSSDPTENGPNHLFGSWIVTLDYKGAQGLFPGVQLVISARQAPVRVAPGPEGLLPIAGRAYAFVPPPSPCPSP